MAPGPRYGMGPLGNFVLVSAGRGEENMAGFFKFVVGDTKVPFLPPSQQVNEIKHAPQVTDGLASVTLAAP